MLLEKWLITKSGQAAEPTSFTLFTWGLNTNGQLGQNDRVNRSSPVQVGSLSWTKLAVGSTHILGIQSDYTLWAWGSNTDGELGQNDAVARSSPTQIGTSSWTQVSAGQGASHGITTLGRLFSWGLNTVGRLGIGDAASRSSPVQVGTSSWAYVNAGVSNTYAIDKNEYLWAWGNNANGSIARDLANKSSPVQVTSIYTQEDQETWISLYGATPFSWSQISVGGTNFAIAIKSDNTLWGWGANDVGQLGNNSTLNQNSPVLIGPGSWTSISAGYDHVIGKIGTGLNTPRVWGANDTYQLGIGDTIYRSSPVAIGTQSTGILAGYKAGYIWAGRSLYATGQNDVGQLGNNTTVNLLGYTNVYTLPTASWTSVKAGNTLNARHVLGLTQTGSLYAWGSGGNGQTIYGGLFNRSNPTQVNSLATQADQDSYIAYSLQTPFSWTAIASGDRHTLAIRNDGKLFTWGYNHVGQLGTNDIDNRISPVQIGGTLSFVKVAAGSSHSLAISTSGTLYSWGANDYGQLLLSNSTVSRSSPVSVASTAVDASISATDASSMYVKGSSAASLPNTMWGAGANGDGRIAYITSGEARSSPVQVGTSFSTIFPSVGSARGAGLKTDGSLWGWGQNNYTYALDAGNRFSPIQITTLLSEAAQEEWITYSGGTPYSWKQISAGGFFILAIRNDNLLFTWGKNDYGMLGDGSTLNKGSPNQVGAQSWTTVSAGAYHSMAIRSDGGLYTWGFNESGQLGYSGTATHRSSPVQVGTATDWTAIAANDASSGGIRANTNMYTWGNNDIGQLGNLNLVNRSSPVQIGSGSSWTQIISSGVYYSGVGRGGQAFVARRSDDVMFIWGVSTVSARGDNINKSSPIQLTTIYTENDQNTWLTYTGGTALSWNQVSVGRSFIAAIRSDGALFMWGNNSSGQLGVLSTTTRLDPAQIGTDSWTQVSCGYSHTIAIKSTGTLWSWGVNTDGGLGNGGTTNRSSPVQIGAATNWSSVSANNTRSYAINSLGQLFGWGLNTSGELGNNAIISRSSPVQIGSGTSYTKVSAGAGGAAAIDTTNSLYTWGQTINGVLGTGYAINRSNPVQVNTIRSLGEQNTYINGFIPALTALSWQQVSIGEDFTVAIASDSSLWTWGTNDVGQLGDGTTLPKLSPAKIGTSSWSTVSAGLSYALAVRSDKLLFAWGVGTSGKLGLNDTLNRSSPVQIGSSSWIMVAAGATSSYGITNDNLLFAWGENNVGQLAGASAVNINRSAPVQIGTSSWSTVSAGLSHALAISSDKLLFAWGVGTSGKLGLNDTLNRSSPVQIGSSSWLMVAAGITTAYGITNDKLLYGWGLNNAGQIGDNSTITRSSPVQVGSSSWTSVAASFSHAVGITTANLAFGWGFADLGQTGISTTAARSNPVQIGSDSWILINAGFNSRISGGLIANSHLFIWGAGSNGQIGNGDFSANTGYSSPVFVRTVSETFVDVEMHGHTLAIRNGDVTNRKLFAWGLNNAGQLGDSSTISKSSPVLITTDSSVTDIAAGDSHSVFIAFNTYTMGLNNSGQLGLNDSINRSAPVQIPVVSGIDYSVHAGWANSAYLNYYQQLYLAGSNAGGVMRNGAGNRSTAVFVPTAIDTFSNVSIGRATGHAIRSDQLLYGWGTNAAGAVGDNSTINRSSPVLIGSSFTMVSNGTSHTVALHANGAIYTWGQNSLGELGLGDTVARSAPVQVGSLSYSQVYASSSFSAAKRTNDQLYLWGYNGYTHLGIQTTINYSSPIFLKGMNDTFSMIGIGHSHSLFLRSDGKLYVQGLNSGGQLGLGDTIQRSAPTQLGTGSWIFVGTTASNSMAIDTSNRLFVWGLNTNGILGLNDTKARSSPVQLPGSFTYVSGGVNNIAFLNSNSQLHITSTGNPSTLGNNTTASASSPVFVRTVEDSWTSIAAGERFSLGIRADGLLFAWGVNTSGNLGDGTTISKSSPTLITLGGNASWAATIAAGMSQSFAIGSNNLLYVWGLNSLGQLGLGDTFARSSPTQLGSKSYTYINAGDSTASAIDSKGQLHMWGEGTAGVIGNTTTGTNYSSPVFIRSITDQWSMASGGGTGANAFTLAIRKDKLLFAWGYNVTGEIGDGTTITKSSPVQLGTGSWLTVAAGVRYALGIRSNGSLFAWGGNNNGQLGLTDTINRSSPTVIGSGQWKKVAIGANASLAISSTNSLFTWGAGTNGSLGSNITTNRSSPVQVGSDKYYDIEAYQGFTTIGAFKI